MSYQVLARRWRPQAFDEVAGQAHVTTPLRNAIRTDRVPHAILFTGPRGVGKTTLARLLARCLNCAKGPTDEPCGECDACREINEGRSTDVQEIDAASRTGVDDVRELIEAVRYAPSPGKHRIFVVDEVHMLSAAAFNALLKTLEEPPPRSLFVFATTNPEKIPFTVLSRCQRYDLRRILVSEMVERLALICRAEQLEVSHKSLLAIARESEGSLRDAQTLLDQVIAYGGGRVDDQQVAELLDLVDRRVLLAILEACLAGDGAAALEACARADAAGTEAKRLGESLLQLLRDLVVLQIAPPEAGLVEGSDDEIAELRELAGRSDSTRLRRMFRALLKEQEDLAWAPRPFAALEMAVLRLATMPAGDDVAQLLARLDALERRLGGSGSGGAPGGDEPAGRPRGGRAGRSRGGRRTTPPTGASPEADVGRAEDAAATPPAASDAGHAAPPAAEAAIAPPPDAPLEVVFDRLRGFTEARNHGLSAALAGGQLLERSESRLRLRVANRFAAQRLRDRRQALEETCASFFGRRLAVEIELADAAQAPDAARPDPEARRRARQRALQHPSINAALEVLEARIVEILPPPDSPEARR